jgi:hypothetical protein
VGKFSRRPGVHKYRQPRHPLCSRAEAAAVHLDELHELWASGKLLEPMKPTSRVVMVTVEQLKAIARTANHLEATMREFESDGCHFSFVGAKGPESIRLFFDALDELSEALMPYREASPK